MLDGYSSIGKLVSGVFLLPTFIMKKEPRVSYGVGSYEFMSGVLMLSVW